MISFVRKISQHPNYTDCIEKMIRSQVRRGLEDINGQVESEQRDERTREENLYAMIGGLSCIGGYKETSLRAGGRVRVYMPHQPTDQLLLGSIIGFAHNSRNVTVRSTASQILKSLGVAGLRRDLRDKYRQDEGLSRGCSRALSDGC